MDRDWREGTHAWTGRGGGGIYSTTCDIARFAAALMGEGVNEHGSVLKPATMAMMFEPHYQPNPRLPGWGLGFARAEVGPHRVVGHDGILPGFNSELLVAPDESRRLDNGVLALRYAPAKER